MKFGLPESLIATFCSVFEKYIEVDEVVIYGSRAKGNFRDGSDIDLTLKGVGITERLCGKIWSDLDDLPHPYLIDLSVYDSLKSESLKEHINRVGQLFYSKQNIRV